jgi:hypothetical protein
MKLTTALRSPYRLGTVVGSGGASRVRRARLRRAIVASRTVTATLCAARAATDWLHGRATFEGGVALMLVIAFTIWVAAEAVGRATRASAPARCDSPYRCPRRPGVDGQ